jgi:hypothetical protein
MAATPFLVPHMPADDLSAAFSLRHAGGAGTGMLPARALTDTPQSEASLQESDRYPRYRSDDRPKSHQQKQRVGRLVTDPAPAFASPMCLLPRSIKLPHDVAVQRQHNADPQEAVRIQAEFPKSQFNKASEQITKIIDEVMSAAKSKDKPKGKSKDKSKDKS